MKKKFTTWLNKSGIPFLLSTLLAIIFFGALSTIYLRSTIQEQENRKTLAHEIILNMNQVTSSIIIGDVGTRGYMLIQEERFAAPLTFAREQYAGHLNTIEEQLKAQQYPEMDSFRIIKEDITAYMGLLNNMYQYVRQGKKEVATDILYQDKGLPLVTGYWQFRDKVIAYEKKVIQDAEQQSQAAIQLISFIQWLLLLLGLPTLLLVLVRIRKSEKSRQQLFTELDSSNKKYIFDPQSEHNERSELDENNIIQSIISNLKQASDFIKAITDGDYSVHWKGMNEHNREANQNNIAGELIQMREQMKEVKEADQRRLWATEGLSKIAEITRKYQHDVQELSDKLVVNVVRYLDANQAGLFTVKDDQADDIKLELSSCYAYERKKYLRKQVEIGEGLLGQAYLEKDTIYMTELPQNYVNITSGLGKSLPGSILIVPLKYNEEVMGVIEIASFKTFEDYQKQFVEDLAEIIASSLSTVKTNARTKALLEQSQEQAEEMRSQEEEMRQNMEELQATQEEMQRKTREYEEIIEEYEKKAAINSEE